jgi:hypothetical protein
MKFHGLSKLVEDPADFRARPPLFPEVWRMPPGPLAALLTLNDMDRILGDGLVPPAMVRIFRKGEKVSPAIYNWTGTPITPGFEQTRAAAISRLLADGHTLVLNQMERIWRPVGDLCRRLSFETGLAVDSGAFLTPPGNSGLDYHWDSLSVLLAQTAGSKTWRLYQPIITDPLHPADWPNVRKLFPVNQADIVKSPPAFEVTMRAGDVLWIPRGWIHCGFATNDPSLHVTFGLPAFTRYWLATQIVETLVERAEMRKELPWGTVQDVGRVADSVSDLIEDLIDVMGKVDRSAVAYDIMKNARSKLLEPTRSPVISVLADDFTSATPIVVIPEAVKGVDPLPDGRLSLDLGDMTVTLGQVMSNAIRQQLELDSRQSWCALDLVPVLSEATATKAVANLLRAGVVRRCDQDESTSVTRTSREESPWMSEARS